MRRELLLTSLLIYVPTGAAVDAATGAAVDAATDLPPIPTRAADVLRVCSYNVENLFDDHDDPQLSEHYEDADATKPIAHVEAVAAVLRAIDADVVALQEIESERALRAFHDKHLAGLGYRHVVSLDAGDERGIEPALLSRHPVVAVENWPRLVLGGEQPAMIEDRENPLAGEPLVYHRTPLSVTVEVPTEGGDAIRVTFFVVHQKSGRASGYWREAEAKRTAARVARLRADRPHHVIVLGDFNCSTSDPGLMPFLEIGLRDVFPERPASEDLSTHSSGRTIDYVLVTPELRRHVHGRPFVVKTPARPRGSDWSMTPHPEGYASDHFPVVVDLRLDAIR